MTTVAIEVPAELRFLLPAVRRGGRLCIEATDTVARIVQLAEFR